MSHLSSERFKLHERFHSRFLKKDRNIIIYLPPGYDAYPHRRYPVCYLHDGQNLFDPQTAFLGKDWGLAQVVDELVAAGELQPMILVGIYNSGEHRLSEYTHVRNKHREGGLARAYSNAILKDLKPLIDRSYRTLASHEHTALGGSSLGGLVTLYIGLLNAAAFGNLIVMSPSVWWANRDILQQVRRAKRTSGQKIWLDVGTCEGSQPEQCVADARDLRDALIRKGWTLGRDLKYVEDEGAEHSEKAWGHRMRDALRFLFPAHTK